MFYRGNLKASQVLSVTFRTVAIYSPSPKTFLGLRSQSHLQHDLAQIVDNTSDPLFRVMWEKEPFFSYFCKYVDVEILLQKNFWIRLNPRFSVPQRNLENSHFVSRPSLRRMGPAAVVTSTQEGWISQVFSCPWGWCNTHSKSAQKRLTEVSSVAAAISQI